jgi:hypothetical protein
MAMLQFTKTVGAYEAGTGLGWLYENGINVRRMASMFGCSLAMASRAVDSLDEFLHNGGIEEE